MTYSLSKELQIWKEESFNKGFKDHYGSKYAFKISASKFNIKKVKAKTNTKI